MSELTLSSTAMLPASQRPVPFRMRADLIVREIAYQGTPSWVIKDPVTLQYHRLTAQQFSLLTRLDGQATYSQLKDDLQQQFPQTYWTLFAVQSMVTDLHTKRLAASSRLGQGRTFIDELRKQKWDKFKQAGASFLFLRLPGVEPTPVLNFLLPFVAWIFQPIVVGTVLMCVAGAGLWVATYFDAFRKDLPEFHQFFAWPNLLYLWLTMAVIKILHELGHGLTCRHFGGECHQIGVMLLVFSPTLYCDVSDAWMMPNKWHRIWIGAAGMFVEMTLSTIALVIWWNTQPGLIHHLALNVFFITTVTTTIFNANPLVRLDGYFMMADFLEIPNLHQKAAKMLQDRFCQTCLGIEPTLDPFDPIHDRGWFILFAIAAAIYRCVLLVTIGLFMYKVLKPYRLESIGAMLAVASFVGFLVRPVWNVTQVIRAPRERPLSRPRIVLTLLLLAAMNGIVTLIPVPIYLETPFTVQPRNVRHVYTVLPGKLVELNVRPGDQVQAGQVLARMTNETKSDELRKLQMELATQKAKVESFHAVGSTAEESLAQQRVENLTQQIQELVTQLAHLVIRAPASGTVIGPPPRPEPDLESVGEKLPAWSGSPLDRENLGMSLTERTQVCSIAPEPGMEAVLLIDQLDRNDLKPEDSIRLKFDHLPDVTYTGTIREISPRQQDYAPPQLSNKSGGTLATVKDQQGRERLASVAYEAIVDVDLPTDLVQTGYRGRARKLLSHRPIAVWAYRWLRRTLYFRI